MNHRILLAGVFLASTLAGCSTLHSKEAIKPAGTSAAQQNAATNGQASAQAANTGAGLSAAELAAQQDAAAQQAKLAQRVVHFDYDQTELHTADEAVLKAHASYLGKHPKARVRLAGHTDERGTTEYNMALGERRAKAVQAYLSAQGVKSSQLDVVSFGKEKPVDTANTEEAWAQNRRVELNYQNEAP